MIIIFNKSFIQNVCNYDQSGVVLFIISTLKEKRTLPKLILYDILHQVFNTFRISVRNIT